MEDKLIIVGVNLFLIFFSYFFFYPRYVEKNAKMISYYDIGFTGLALIIAGSFFYDSGIEFNILNSSFNWFWFTFITYFAMEIPLMCWYFTKHRLWASHQEEIK